MSSKNSAEFKAKIALEALALSVGELDELAKKHGVSQVDIIAWVDQLKKNAPSLFTDGATELSSITGEGVVEDFSYETNDQVFLEDLEIGVTTDKLNLKRISIWSGFGVVFVTLTIIALVNFAGFALKGAQQKASENSGYPEIIKLKADQNKTLNTFGVVDAEKGIYRIPIEKAIEKIAEN